MKSDNFILRGQSVSPGLVEGNIFVFQNETENVSSYDIEDVNTEIERFRNAIGETKNDLVNIKNKVIEQIGLEYTEIFEAQILALEDRTVLEKTEKEIIRQKKNADYLYYEVVKNIIENMARIDDDYLKDRIYDIKDILNKVLRKLKRKNDFKYHFHKPVILAAGNFTPTDLMNIDKENIAGMITEKGGVTSHFAIMARAMNIPSIVGVNDLLNTVKMWDNAIIDGFTGIIILNPDETSKKTYLKKKKEYDKFTEELKQVVELDAVTLDERNIEVSSNIEFVDELDEVKKYGSKGIGLFRTEFLFMNQKKFPDINEQESVYKKIADSVYPDSLIIRTVDIGGDKPIFVNRVEDNPALGYRGIRVSLEMKEIFKVQIEAILRANKKGNIKIMLPLVSKIDELDAAKTILEEVKKDLKKKNVQFEEEIDLGIMVEVPSCALLSEFFAKKADFFSIGTNDLTQYTLAVDRTNIKVASTFDHLDPSVLWLIDRTIRSGHDEHIWVGVCGEMASDPIAVPILIGLGVDELSMAPVFIPEIKIIIREITYKECIEIAKTALSFGSAEEVREYMHDIIIKKLPNMKKYVLER